MRAVPLSLKDSHAWIADRLPIRDAILICNEVRRSNRHKLCNYLKHTDIGLFGPIDHVESERLDY